MLTTNKEMQVRIKSTIALSLAPDREDCRPQSIWVGTTGMSSRARPGGGRTWHARRIENVLTHHEISGREIIERGIEQAKNFKVHLSGSALLRCRRMNTSWCPPAMPYIDRDLSLPQRVFMISFLHRERSSVPWHQLFYLR